MRWEYLKKGMKKNLSNVNELIRLQNKYHHNQLYSENIRLYLGDRAAVEKVVSMVQATLAYRAVFEFGGQKLRARIGQSRVFQKEESERIYKNDYLENDGELNELSVKC